MSEFRCTYCGDLFDTDEKAEACTVADYAYEDERAGNYEDAEENDDFEPDLDFGFEHDSAMMSVGWGTDEDYGYYGGDDY